ncbi:MAG TPA: PHP domain-containing protein, partial [Cytophagaceae bacterium]
MYINCHTYYSFKYGTLTPEELFECAKENGVVKLILTQINNTCGWIEFAKHCSLRRDEYKLDFSLGIEFRLENQLLYIAVAKNNRGFEEINRFLSEYNLTHKPFPQIAPAFENAFVIYEWKKDFNLQLAEHEYLGIRPSCLNKLFNFNNQTYLKKLVLLHPITFKNKTGYNVHKLLRAIDLNTLVSKLLPEDICGQDEYMLPCNVVKERCKKYPQLIENANYIIENSEFIADLQSEKNKKTFGNTLKEDIDTLRNLTFNGLNKRYACHRKREEANVRAEKELTVIRKLNFEAYFLINYDIINFATKRGFAYVGRGSGANSLVSYCLGITDVDPISLDLYFERFLNMYRSSPPDFDIDFSWKDRDEIIKYIFEKYGSDYTALLATYTTFQGRSIVRELGKVFGLPKREIEGILQNTEQNRDRDRITKAIFKYAELIKDFPKNLSIHAGGILISEKPIYCYTATSHPPKDFATTHFNMWEAEDLRIFKFDILSQRGLGHIKDTVTLIKENRNEEVSVNNFESLMIDPKISALLKTGRTMGCFYVESPSMRMLLGKLTCETYSVLVAASSIIRPGVASSGMMREYIYRHHNPDKFEYIHPKMEELMKETYGVMVYQEDVIKVVHHFGKLNLAEADIIRRGMSGKLRSKSAFQILEKKYFDNCEKAGYAKDVAQEVWRQIESFSGYSFSKAHSASFAVESYQSLFLKAYYPLEFMVGVIN